MFRKLGIFVLVLAISFILVTIRPQEDVLAQQCNQSSECSGQVGLTCFCVTGGSNCNGGYCLGDNTGQSSGTCSCTNGGPTCTGSGYSACVDCSQWRVCTNSGQLQVQWCQSGSCTGGAGDPPPSGNPSCTVSLSPTSTTVAALSATTFSASVAMSGAAITSVNFSSSNPSVATVSPSSDTTSAYETIATGVSSGTSTITANVIANGSTLCTTTATLNVLPVGAWWQVKDGDITATGNISSYIPTSSYVFDDIGDGGFPGVPVYSSAISTGLGSISTTGWNANAATSPERRFGYSYFENLVPEDVVYSDITLLPTGGPVQYGYEWYKVTGDYTVSSDIDFGSRKVILFVETGNLNIDAKINLTDNSGFFGAFVNGDINVSPLVTAVGPALEGIYLTDQSFDTGILGNTQLHIRGSVVSYGGMSLSRDLTNNASAPAELFEFAPDQVVLFPEKLGFRAQKWLEVAP